MEERKRENVSIQFRLPVTHRYLNTVDACVIEMFARIPNSPTEELGYQVQLAVHEICANVVDHSGASGEFDIAVNLDVDNRTFVIETSDNGTRAYKPTRLKLPDAGELTTRGRGLWLIRQTMDEIIYRSCQGQVWDCDKEGHWKLQTDTPTTETPNRNIWRICKAW